MKRHPADTMHALQEMLGLLGCRRTLNWQIHNIRSVLALFVCGKHIGFCFPSSLSQSTLSQPLHRGRATLEPHPAQSRPWHFNAYTSHCLGGYCNHTGWVINLWIDTMILANKSCFWRFNYELWRISDCESAFGSCRRSDDPPASFVISLGFILVRNSR